jgi:hypothetical protein
MERSSGEISLSIVVCCASSARIGLSSAYELAALVKAMIESPSEIACIPYEQAYEAGFEDMACRLSDLSKIQRAIDYRKATTTIRREA